MNVRRGTFYVGALTVLGCAAAFAELQNVQAGGQIRLRARYWSNFYADPGEEIRIPAFFLPKRPIGPFGTASPLNLSDRGNARGRVEQSTKLRVTADFTDRVKGLIEVDAFEIWGRDFRSDYVTGVDARANSGDDVELLQAYIETEQTWGQPLRLRIGRQQILLGSGWLVGETQSTINQFFDGIRATYTVGDAAIDGWWMKLAERGGVEEDGDVDFYGLNASYSGFEGQDWMAYWLYVRDGASINDTNFIAPLEWFEDVLNLDDYDPTNLHTVGVRGEGAFGRFDYALEAAYQTGNADSVGALFRPFLYGDNGARYDTWAGDIELGYTFDVPWQPRVFAGGVYYGGEDNRDLSFWEWVNPFYRPEASVSFNRLFSSIKYLDLLDEDRNTTNFNHLRLGVEARPTESLQATFAMYWLRVVEAFDRPLAVPIGPFQVPVAPALAFLTEESDRDLGVVARLQFAYKYSEDLSFRLIFEHLAAGDGFDAGSFLYQNGLLFSGGRGADDANYVEFETKLTF